jgi:CDP-diacylglycerol--glycerol-3-phosphate 3-phosphatidyltransferase
MAYALIESQFYRQFSPTTLTLREFNRPGWTFHSKGMWFRPDKTAAPVLTVVGSSNFGQRSYGRDLESQVPPVLYRNIFFLRASTFE